MIKWATFREILLPSSGNVNGYVGLKEVCAFTETIKLTDKKKLHNVAN